MIREVRDITAKVSYSKIVPGETLRKFWNKLVGICIEEESNVLQISYEGLVEKTGFSKGTVYKSLQALIELGYIEKRTDKSRRIPNTYIIKGPLETDRGPEFSEVKDFVHLWHELQEELNNLRVELDAKTALLGQDSDKLEMVNRVELPDNLIQVTFRKKE